MAKVRAGKVPVSERALLQRINRKLAAEDELVRQSRPVYDRGGRDPDRPIYDQNVGKFYRIDTRRNFLIEKDLDLEALGREIGALAAWEEVKE